MKSLFFLASVMAVLLLAAPIKTEAQKRKTANRSAFIWPPAKCAVTVRNDLIPHKGIVVVGCDSFGDTPFSALNDNGTTRQDYIPNSGGLIVFDAEMNVVFRWTASTSAGGFFSSFAGTKKVKRHNALLVKLVGGPRRDDGKPTAPLLLPLYFNGREFKLDRYSTNNVLPE